MNKATLAALLGMALATAHAQNAKPLSQSELLRTLDGLGTGDPLTKQPLSLDDDPAPRAERNAESDPPKKEKGPTEITSNEATFEQRTHRAVFSGSVVVIDPEFHLTCDKLTALLKHDEKATPGAPKPAVAAAAKPPKPKETPDAEEAKAKPKNGKGGGGLEKATAEGHVVITQEKRDAGGSVTKNVGRGTKAIYEADTGDITLYGMPQVQQGFNTCIATDESTVITLNRDGRMKVIGPHKTVIQSSSESGR